MAMAMMIVGARPAGAITATGQGDTVSANDNKLRSGLTPQPPTDRPGKPGPPRIFGRGRGDPPPKPALWWIEGKGVCVTGLPNFPFTYPGTGEKTVFPNCNGTAGPPPPTPLEAAYEAWYWETKLPSPTMATSPPNGAITGLDLYLAIGGDQTLSYDIPALGYNVRLDVTSVYDVNWGDRKPDNSSVLGRAVTKGHRTQGGMYPSGDLRHQYIERGSATIEVTQRWTATWSAGGQSGTIADRLATSATLTIPVQEIQAVLRP